MIRDPETITWDYLSNDYSHSSLRDAFDRFHRELDVTFGRTDQTCGQIDLAPDRIRPIDNQRVYYSRHSNSGRSDHISGYSATSSSYDEIMNLAMSLGNQSSYTLGDWALDKIRINGKRSEKPREECSPCNLDELMQILND